MLIPSNVQIVVNGAAQQDMASVFPALVGSVGAAFSSYVKGSKNRSRPLSGTFVPSTLASIITRLFLLSRIFAPTFQKLAAFVDDVGWVWNQLYGLIEVGEDVLTIEGWRVL